MPVVISENGLNSSDVSCAECHAGETALVVRTRHLCRDCFIKYITTKVLKRLETNKIRAGFNDEEKTLLVPVSFGVSSICLLNLLDSQLRARAEQGRHAGYKLHVLLVDQSTVVDQKFPEELVAPLKQRFPSHRYTNISLSDVEEYDIGFDEMNSAEEQGLECIIASLPSSTSRIDFIEIARRRLIHAFAKKYGCDSILLGDSTTRLAERTLSETSKGRGSALPWLTADGVSSEGITCIYPMRDLLRKELAAYAGIASPSLMPLIQGDSTETLASSKNVTIDGLMSQYFESVEQNYPSIVANVVRTSGKLVASSVPEGSRACSLCKSAVLTESWGGDQQAVGFLQTTGDNIDSRKDQALCYGCARTVLKP